MPRARALARRRPAGCATPSAGTRVRRRGRRDRHARDLPDRARRWRATPAWPTSRSRCRASARARSASPARRSRRRATCRASRAARRSPPSRCPSPTPAPTSRRMALRRARRRRRRACSTARRPGSPTAASPTSTSCSRARGEAPGARGISAFIVDAGTPGFEIAERIDVIAPHPLARLRFADCRIPLDAAHRRAPARASRSRCARSTCSAPRWPPPRSASRAARSTRRCSARPRARCSTRRWPTSS